MKQKLKLLVLLFFASALPAFVLAQVSVSGTVTDANNNPVIGASVKLRNSNVGTSTDANGRFTLSLPGAGGTLEISSIGFKTQTVEASASNNTLAIKMAEDVGRLDEVVVTGLATSVKRRNLANSVATISAKQLAGTAPAQTFDAALNGKVTGAYINANSGAPGGGMSVKLRGVTSIFGNTQPLYVLDGVFIDNTATPAGLNVVTQAAAAGNASNQDNPSSRIADLRPEEIENVEILKGAAAAAIYGSKAAAGVVIITTKRGKAGKTAINFSQDLGVIKVRKLLGPRPLDVKKVTDQGWDVNEYNAAVAAGKVYDYEKEIYGQNGLLSNSILSLSGGSEKTSFYLSASHRNEEGIIARTGYKASSIRLNVDHRISDNVKIGLSTNYINSSADRGLTNNDNAGVTYGVALSSTPNFTELHPDANGNYPRNKYAGSNPIETRDKMTNNEGVNRFIIGLNLDAILHKATKSVTRLIARGGVDFYNLRTDAQFPASLQFQQVNKGTSIQGFTKNLNTNYIVSLVNVFNASDKASFTTSIGATQETGNYDNLLNIATQVISGQSNVDQAGALTATQFRTKNYDNGFFAQEEISLMDAFTINAGIRFDKSTNNGDPDKYYSYPKAGVSWNLTKMDFWSIDFFDNLKVRAAYGQAGNFPAYGSKFTSLLVSNISGLPGSLVSTQQGNPNILPERQTELEAGVDFSILGSRLNFEFTYYSKKIFDFLLLRTVPASSGFSTQWVNAGDLKNHGIEMSLNAQPIVSQTIRWSTTLNFWMNRSEVTKLDIPPVELGGFGTTLGTFKIEQGQSATQIVGIDGATGVHKMGDQEPKFQMNWFNELTLWKHLSLRFLFHLKQGGDNLNLTELLTDLGGTSPDYDADANGNGVNDAQDRINALGVTARPFIQDAGYLRLREIGVYYTFSKMPFSFVKGLRVGASAYNYLTWTNYKSYDPEVSNFGTGFSTGVEVTPFPSSKRASLHLSVDF